VLDKLVRRQSLVVAHGELVCCAVECATKAVADGEQAGAERRDQVLARTRRHDRVVGARHGWSVVGCEHEHHLDKPK